ncbi:hypothetical protein J3P71_04920 [Rhizobium leguminosarum]|uniref:hypothetical protein n=1 Tax=Rhizobium leguminosarum TaxID=384 RepID=UPI0014411C6A|nr:hypothetical protein [Rhizobium leguminosarum]MBY5836604.1 hypothetical protein [Rhizobium leguminosarum]NKM79395.1 hypothetical protein [Rhizobium leguminosarum bv. viciae]QSZ09125.1 hypothetical protein J3P71_04920 [Rhizobium leguminosarum]
MKKDIGFTTVGRTLSSSSKPFPSLATERSITVHVTKIAADAILEPVARHEGDPAARQAKTTFSGAETMWTSRFPDITEPETY